MDIANEKCVVVIDGELPAGIAVNTGAVSYTHLDVYKRQRGGTGFLRRRTHCGEAQRFHKECAERCKRAELPDGRICSHQQ